MKWLFWCDGAEETFEADDLDEAVAACRDWLDEGDWDRSSPGRVHGRVYALDENGVESSDYTDVVLEIEQDEPPCSEGLEHEWSSDYDLVGGCREAPGVYGHGGGVKIHEVCRHCGCMKITDTWPQDPETGEQGGWTEVSYKEGCCD